MTGQNSLVSVFATHEQAEAAVRELQAAGFDMKKLSVVARDYHREQKITGYYNTGDQARSWGSSGGFWSMVWSLLLGSAFVIMPEIGPLLVAGPLVSSLVAAGEEAVALGEMSPLGKALQGLGIPEHRVQDYETEIKAGKYLVVAHGTESDVEQAREILARIGGTQE